MKETITVDKKYLEEVIGFSSSKLVGKILKRYEIVEDKNTLKKEIKELIYESYRDLRDILIAYNKGYEVSIYNLKKKR